MKNILILQNEIMQYRKALYNKLSELYNITVFHSGHKSVDDVDLYRENLTKVFKIGPFHFQKGVISEIRKGEYDVIIAMFDLRWVTNILALLLNSEKRFIYWGHRYSRYRFVNHLRNYLMKRSDAIILYNNEEVNRIIESGLEPDKIFIAENTIYVENHEDLSNEPKSSFLYVGRLQQRKKLDELLYAFADIMDEIAIEITIDIVGDGEESSHLRKLSDEIGLGERIIFHGTIIQPEKLKSVFAKAYAYVSPDAVGLGVQHSFAYGVPVITTFDGFKGAEYQNLHNQENSILFSGKEGLKRSLINICTNQDLRKRLGQNAYELYSKRMTMEIMAQGFIDAIEYSE